MNRVHHPELESELSSLAIVLVILSGFGGVHT